MKRSVTFSMLTTSSSRSRKYFFHRETGIVVDVMADAFIHAYFVIDKDFSGNITLQELVDYMKVNKLDETFVQVGNRKAPWWFTAQKSRKPDNIAKVSNLHEYKTLHLWMFKHMRLCSTRHKELAWHSVDSYPYFTQKCFTYLLSTHRTLLMHATDKQFGLQLFLWQQRLSAFSNVF